MQGRKYCLTSKEIGLERKNRGKMKEQKKKQEYSLSRRITAYLLFSYDQLFLVLLKVKILLYFGHV